MALSRPAPPGVRLVYSTARGKDFEIQSQSSTPPRTDAAIAWRGHGLPPERPARRAGGTEEGLESRQCDGPGLQHSTSGHGSPAKAPALDRNDAERAQLSSCGPGLARGWTAGVRHPQPSVFAGKGSGDRRRSDWMPHGETGDAERLSEQGQHRGRGAYSPGDQPYAPGDQPYAPGDQPYSPGDQTYSLRTQNLLRANNCGEDDKKDH